MRNGPRLRQNNKKYGAKGGPLPWTDFGCILYENYFPGELKTTKRVSGTLCFVLQYLIVVIHARQISPTLITPDFYHPLQESVKIKLNCILWSQNCIDELCNIFETQ